MAEATIVLKLLPQLMKACKESRGSTPKENFLPRMMACLFSTRCSLKPVISALFGSQHRWGRIFATVLLFYAYYILLIQYRLPVFQPFSNVLRYPPPAPPLLDFDKQLLQSYRDHQVLAKQDDYDEPGDDQQPSMTEAKPIQKNLFDFREDAKKRNISLSRPAHPGVHFRASQLNITTWPTDHCRYPNPAHIDDQVHAFIIGPQKTGTTFLTDLLVGVTDKNFPDVFGSTPKETGFYLTQNFDLQDFGNLTKKELSKAYHDFIWPGNDPKKYNVLLEASASNILKNSFIVIRSFSKAPRYLMLLRDPAKRYFSELNHVHRKFFGADKSEAKIKNHVAEQIHNAQDLHKQTIKQIALGEKSNFLMKGNYAALLNKWKHRFCNSMMIIDQKDINNVAYIKQILKHIGAKIPSDSVIKDSMKIARDKYKKEYGAPEWHTLPKPAPETVQAVDWYYENANQKLWEMLNIDIPWF